MITDDDEKQNAMIVNMLIMMVVSFSQVYSNWHHSSNANDEMQIAMMRMDCSDDCADFMVRLATSKKTVVGPRKKQKATLIRKEK